MSTPNTLPQKTGLQSVLHGGRTWATQSDEAKARFATKAFEASLQALRFAFAAGRTTTLHAICNILKIEPVGPDRHVSKEELNTLVLAGREALAKRLAGSPAPTTQTDAPKSATTVVVETPSATPPTPKPDTSPAPAAVTSESTSADDQGDDAIPLPELLANKKVQPFGFQVRKTRELLRNITINKHRANLLLSQTGSGKTFMLGAMMAALKRMKFFDDYAGMYPMLYVTKASIVEQTTGVLQSCFGLDDLDVMVTNIEQLRSTIGRVFIQEETVIVQGQEHIVFKWRPRSLPRLIIWDESQILKNIDSTQSRIAQALNDINTVTHGPEADRVVQVFSSATPFMRLVETKCFAVATRAEIIEI